MSNEQKSAAEVLYGQNHVATSRQWVSKEPNVNSNAEMGELLYGDLGPNQPKQCDDDSREGGRKEAEVIRATDGTILLEGATDSVSDKAYLISVNNLFLRDADLSGMDMTGKIMKSTQAKEASIAGARLDGGDWRFSDLRSVDARGTSFRNCDLQAADVTGMIVDSNTDVTGAKLGAVKGKEIFRNCKGYSEASHR